MSDFQTITDLKTGAIYTSSPNDLSRFLVDHELDFHLQFPDEKEDYSYSLSFDNYDDGNCWAIHALYNGKWGKWDDIFELRPELYKVEKGTKG